MLVAACDLGRHEVVEGEPDPTQASTACSSTCHGEGGEAAPPRDTIGRANTDAIGVGAHRAHIGSSKMHKRIECATCHMVPQEIGAPGHIDTALPAELTFGGIADGSVWNRDTATCSNNYCHGASLTNTIGGSSGSAGGAATEPVWTLVDGSQRQCESCHGYPPPAPHPQNPDCGTCHPTMNPGQDRELAYAELHVDGRLDVIETAACDSCHGANGQSAPPKDTAGNVATSQRGVGAHAQHLVTNPTWHAAMACTDCHRIPAGVNDQGHVDTPLPAEIVFSTFAGAGTYNGSTCSNTYCHGGGTSPLAGGSHTSPVWTQVDGTQSQCGSCHGAPPPPPHPVDSDCGSCHQTMIAGGGLTIAYPALHIDGKVDVNTDRPCDSCHGSNGNAA
ncbi:MAG: Multiheme cytochrome, partial [Deltaproteobacteria bacterium]|nr:Multiheme cytochrome [Deltaproteobacteria bacterium]